MPQFQDRQRMEQVNHRYALAYVGTRNTLSCQAKRDRAWQRFARCILGTAWLRRSCSHPVFGFHGEQGEFVRMNRFFSKLDLRDIKISPEGSRFPPDADEAEEPAHKAVDDATPEGPLSEVSVAEVTNWESPTFSPSGASPNGISHEVEAAVEPAPEAAPAPEPEITRARAGYEVDGVLIAADGEVLKVSARSRPSAVAGAIAGVVREAGRAEVQAIGAGATNQAVKAVAIARDYLRETGIEAVCLPAFIDVTIENEDRTAIRLVIEPR